MGTNADTAAIIAAGGSGSRFGRLKQFMPLAGKPMLVHSLDVFASLEEVAGIVVVCPAEHCEQGRELGQHGHAVRLCGVRRISGVFVG